MASQHQRGKRAKGEHTESTFTTRALVVLDQLVSRPHLPVGNTTVTLQEVAQTLGSTLLVAHLWAALLVDSQQKLGFAWHSEQDKRVTSRQPP